MGFWKQFFIIIVSSLVITSFVESFSELSWKNCGKQVVRGPKIVGGVNAYEGEFPWLVSIKEDGKHFCAGLIIGARQILTACHCFADFSYRSLEEPRTILVTLGEYDLRNSSTSSASMNVTVKRIIKHPDYKQENFENDIAILYLKEDIMWTDYASPICLPNNGLTYSEKEIGELAFVAGWGQTEEQMRTSSSSWSSENTLQKVNLTIYENQDCQKMFMKKHISQNITSGHICAGYAQGGLDSCRGDSGGGLILLDSETNRWTVIGIVSAGRGCAQQGMPSLYTRVARYLDWIGSILNTKEVSRHNLLPQNVGNENEIVNSKIVDMDFQWPFRNI